MNDYLHQSKYVKFTQRATSSLLAESLQNIDSIHNYIVSNILYDYIKAKTIENIYIPNPDETLHSRFGICFDIAALFAAMVRHIGIPCKLVIGHADNEYHAWNEVLVDGNWVRFDLTNDITGRKFIVYNNEKIY